MRITRHVLALGVAVAVGWAAVETRGEPLSVAPEAGAAGDAVRGGRGHRLPPRPAPPPKASVSRAAGETALPGRSEFWWSSFGGVCIVVALVLVGARVVRRWAPLGPPTLPREALEVLGRAQLTAKHTVYMVRCGKSVLVVGATAEHVDRLAEITDAAEVDYLVGLCGRSRDRSGAASFRQALESEAGTMRGVADLAGEEPSSAGGRQGDPVHSGASRLLETGNAWKSKA